MCLTATDDFPAGRVDPLQQDYSKFQQLCILLVFSSITACKVRNVRPWLVELVYSFLVDASGSR